MRGSGKQVLLKILYGLSTRVTAEGDLGRATRRLRAGLLLRGGAMDENLENAGRLCWFAERDCGGEVVRQGVAVGDSGAFLSDILERILEAPGLWDYVQEEYPGLQRRDWDACVWCLWAIVSSVQYYIDIADAEADGDVDVDYWINGMLKKMDYYENP